MANSDNVLRGGLTPKHINVNELLKHTLFEAVEPKILKPETIRNEKNYVCPVDDFGINAIELKAGEQYYAQTNSLEIILVIEGAIIIQGKENFVIKKGEAFAVAASAEYSFTSTGNSLLYRAFVPYKQ